MKKTAIILGTYIALACSGQTSLTASIDNNTFYASPEGNTHKALLVKGIQAIGLNGFTTGLGKGADANYNRFLGSDIWFRVGLKTEFGKYKSLKFNATSLYVNFDKSLYSVKDFMFWNLGVGVVGNRSSFSTALSEGTSFNKNGFNAGISLQTSLDFYITDNIVVYPYFKQEAYLMKYMQTYVFNAGIGARYQF